MTARARRILAAIVGTLLVWRDQSAGEPSRASGPEASAQHPWDGDTRAAWIEDAAKRTFVLEGYPDLRRLPEICDGRCPDSLYVSPQPSAAEQDLHVIGVYEGPPADATPDGRMMGRPIEVLVRKTAKPLVLMLTSYERVSWKLELEDGAHLAGVYTGAESEVDVPPPGPSPVRIGVPVSLYRLRPDDKDDEGNSETGERALEGIGKSLKLPVDSFQ